MATKEKAKATPLMADKANDKDLGILHGKLAGMMNKALDSSDEAELLLDTYKDELPGEVIDYLLKQKNYSPSLFTAVAKFLKDNDITAVIEDKPEMSDLERRLANKKRKSVGNVTSLHEED